MEHAEMTTEASMLAPESNQISQQLKSGLDQLVSHYHLKPEMVESRVFLIQDLLESMIINPVNVDDGQQESWGWQPALESPDLSVGALTVWKDSEIPLHDHPGSAGLLLVLEGSIRIRSYRMLGNQEISQQPIELELTNDSIIDTGDCWHFGPHEHNIHSLQAVDGDCRLFDVLFSPYQLQQRSFYMPIVPNNDARNIYVTRLSKLRNRSVH